MKQDITYSIIIFIVVAIGSLTARLFQLYDLFWFTDIVLHTLSGLGFGFFWLYLDKDTRSRFKTMLGCVSLAVFGSLLWEYGELGAWKFLPFYAPFYSPNFFDTIGDITCGMVGGLIASITLFFKKNRRKRFDIRKF